MDWAFSLPITAAIAGLTIGYVAKRFFDALEGPTEYIDTVDLPPELQKDEALIQITWRDDYLGWNELCA
jgi:hypothetical protein